MYRKDVENLSVKYVNQKM